MTLFHDEEDGPNEPIRGLPQLLPEGERILWQDRADGRTLAIHAFHIRTVTLYLGLAVLVRGAVDASAGRPLAEIAGNGAVTALLTGIAVAVLSVMAFFMAKRSLFTLTNKRLVIRHGVALKKYINIPFADVTAAKVRRHPDGTGDIALDTAKGRSVPYYHLWPFARPMRFTRTVPVLRALPDVDVAARKLTAAMTDAAPDAVRVAPRSHPEDAVGNFGAPSLNPEASLS
jgi:hypothetical protein